MKLLKKEFGLCMHPFGYLTPVFSAMVLIPGYPYTVCCFYTTLAIFFICLSARENHDAAYTLTLPVSRRDAVEGRILLCVCMETVQLITMGIFIWIKYLIGAMPNPAGLDAGLALIADGMVVYALFNLVFFPIYYRDINKPGVSFMIASAAVFLWILLEVIATYTVPFVRYRLDTADPAYLEDKALFTLGAAALFAAGTWMAFLRSVKKFESADLSL